MGKKKKSTTGGDNNHTQYVLAWNAYHETLKNVDKQILRQFRYSTTHVRSAMWSQVIVHGLGLIVVCVTLFWSLNQAFQNQQNANWPWLIVLVSLVLLGIFLYRNPAKDIYKVVLDLARIQLIFQGHTRQLHQSDAVFRQYLLSDQVDGEILMQLNEYTQSVIDNNLENLLQSLDNLDL